MEDENERIFSEKVKELNKEKRKRRLEKLKEEEERQPTMMKKLKKICIEISNENVMKWKERKNKIEKEKKEGDRKETEDWKRFKRVRIAEDKKKTLIKKLGNRKRKRRDRKEADS